MWQEYLFPASVQEALEMLDSYKGEARIVAGGTDLILELKEGKRGEFGSSQRLRETNGSE